MEHERDPQAIVVDVLDGIKRGLDDQQPEAVAALFAEDALFQGSHPEPSFGSAAVAEYFAEPRAKGLRVDYTIRHICPLAEDVVSAFVNATFTLPNGTALPRHLTVIILRQDDGRWLIGHYHASAID